MGAGASPGADNGVVHHSRLGRPWVAAAHFSDSHPGKRVKNPNFTVIASNCIGGLVHQVLDLPYKTPFAGLYLFAPCYMRLVRDVEGYLRSPLEFSPTSRYAQARALDVMHPYPIGLLGGNVEIHFLHFSGDNEAKETWNRRVAGIHRDNLFFCLTDKDLWTEAIMADFDKLLYPNKVCFTARRFPKFSSAIWFPECSRESKVVALYTNPYLLWCHFNFAGWINGGTGRVSPLLESFNHLWYRP